MSPIVQRLPRRVCKERLTFAFNVDESMSSEGPTVFEAVQRQLGLKLEARKGPVEVVVIDHVEKPSVN